VSLAKALAFAADNADEIVDVAKLGVETVKAIHAWVNGDGPEPVELAAAPDTTRMKLSQARLERLAASGGTGGA
jgi:hypothetical protein